MMFFEMKKVKIWMIFEELYLLHPPLNYNFIFWDGFQLDYGFNGRNLDSINGVLKVNKNLKRLMSSIPPSLDLKIMVM